MFAAGIGRASATLFLDACVAPASFPMLARIIDGHGLADSALGIGALMNSRGPMELIIIKHRAAQRDHRPDAVRALLHSLRPASAQSALDDALARAGREAG